MKRVAIESLVPDFEEAEAFLKGLSPYDLFGVIAHTGEFLDWCDPKDQSLIPKIDALLTEHVAALLLYREQETNLPTDLPEDSPSIPKELQVLRRVKHEGVTALSEYCFFYAEEWRRIEGDGAVRLANQWRALGDTVSTFSEVPRKLPVRAVGS